MYSSEISVITLFALVTTYHYYHLPPDTAEITSSTYRFQKKGLTGEVAKALCSKSSITMLDVERQFGTRLK